MANTSPKPFVFVLMPFKDEFNDIYKLGIKPACKAAGAYCERVDDQEYEERSILDRIYNQIAKADIIVSDMSGQNPNVFYETGYAHALGKRTVLLTQRVEDIPFDLKHSPHIIYGKSIDDLKKKLTLKVRYLVQHPEKKQPVSSEMLKYHINGKDVATGANVELTPRTHDKAQGWTIGFDIHNPGDKVLDVSDMSFGVVFPVTLGQPIYTHESFVRIDDLRYMYLADYMIGTRILPKCWAHRTIQIHSKEMLKYSGVLVAEKHAFTAAHLCAVRVFSELGMQEYPFTIWVKIEADVP